MFKRCRVCGDQATGFNYRGLTCEPCKVFFIRNIDQYETFKCNSTGDCTIEKSNRKSCRKCRLEKCIQTGMKIPLIKNKDNCQIARRVVDKPSVGFQFIENLFTYDKLVLLLADTNPGPNMANFGANNNQLVEVRKRRHATKFTAYEQSKIDEITAAVGVFIDERQVSPVNVRAATDIYEGFTTTHLYMKMIVRFCKRIPAFMAMSPADQCAALKPFCFDLNMIRYAYLFDFERRGLPLILDETGTDAIFMTFDKLSHIKDVQHVKIAMENAAFTRKLQNAIDNDANIRDLLIAFVLFKRLEPLSCPEFARYNFAIYSRLLQRYLEQKYKSVKVAQVKYSNLTKLVDKFSQMKANERVLFSLLDRTRIPDICVELFDL